MKCHCCKKQYTGQINWDFFWIVNSDNKIRFIMCESCNNTDFNTITQSMNLGVGYQKGVDIPLSEMLEQTFCNDCKIAFVNEQDIVPIHFNSKIKLYHKECAGIYENVKNI